MFIPNFYFIQVRALTLQSARSLRCRYVVREAGGRLAVGEVALTLGTAKTLVSERQVIVGGELLFVSVVADQAGTTAGQMRAQVDLVPTAGVGSYPEIFIMEGSVDEGQPLTWSDGNVAGIGSSASVLTYITFPTVAAGLPLVYATTNFAITQVQAVSWELVTNATAATRTVVWSVQEGGNVIPIGTPQIAQAANTSWRYSAAPNRFVTATTGEAIMVTGAGVGVTAGGSVIVSAVNLQAGDLIQDGRMLANWVLHPGTV